MIQHVEGYKFLKCFFGVAKSVPLLAIEAFLKLLTPKGKAASQVTVFDALLKRLKKKNQLTSFEERRFGLNCK